MNYSDIKNRMADPSYCAGAKKDISFLLSEIDRLDQKLDRRDALIYRIRLASGNAPISEMIRQELGEKAREALGEE